jgi:uncharacterized protein YndB with AHSA1/START domain
MAAPATPPAEAGDVQPFVITRVVDAPRDLVWRVFTEAEHLRRWFGPKGFTMPTCTLDLRPGGIFHYQLRAPDGTELWGKWLFKEIVPPERLVVIVSFSDAQLGTTRHPWAADWPLETLGTTVLTEQGDKTLVTVTWTPYRPTPAEAAAFEAGRDSMRQGWTGTFEQLEAYLAGLAERGEGRR